MEVHKLLGPGLLESAYQTCLAHELRLRAIPFQREVTLPIAYKGELLESGYRIDFVIGKELIVELKSVEQLLPIHEAQIITYMKLANTGDGLLINFNVPILCYGIRRMFWPPLKPPHLRSSV